MAFGSHFVIPRWFFRPMPSLDLITTAPWWLIPKFWNAWRNTLVFTVLFHRSGNGSWAFDGPDSFRDLWGTWLGTRFDAYPLGHPDGGHFQDVRLDVRRTERHR